MRLLTPDVEDAIRWFYWTHTLDTSFGSARWSLTQLPGPGAVGEQDARVWQTLEHLRGVANALLREAPKTGADDELRTFHAKHRRG